MEHETDLVRHGSEDVKASNQFATPHPDADVWTTEYERKCVARASDGDTAAVGELYDAYIDRLYRYCLVRVRNEADAEDLAEEIFLKVFRSIGRFEWRDFGKDDSGATRSSFAAWLFRIAQNHVISFHRQAARRGTSLEVPAWLPDDQRGPQELTELSLNIEEVFTAVTQLSEAQQEVIQLRFGAGLSVLETAEALGKREANVKVWQHKGVKRLQELLGRENSLPAWHVDSQQTGG